MNFLSFQLKISYLIWHLELIIDSYEYTLTGIFLWWYIVDMKTISVLAEPNRLLIVELLREGPLSVGEITERLGFNQPQVSKHLKVLSEAGYVEVEAIANRRIYRLRPEPFQELYTWIESYRNIWDERYNRLEDYLQKLQGKEVDFDNKETK